MNIHSTIQYICISTIQVHEHYKRQEKVNTEITQKIQEENTENTKKITENTNILPGNEPGPSSL
jgi:hypothetical protein